MEHLVAGAAASCASVFTNPLEVAKIRQQLQGELRTRGNYVKHYHNAVHACYVISSVEGVRSLQKGLVPALFYQFVMNGSRIGTYQCIQNLGLTTDVNGKTSMPLNALAGSMSGCVAVALGNPLCLVKTHMQSHSNHSIAVGHQHGYTGIIHAFREIVTTQGVKGLWRGTNAALLRMSVGSGVQLSTFSAGMEYIESLQLFPRDSCLATIAASIATGLINTVVITPFDVVSTRLYNQKYTGCRRSAAYSSVKDCFVKIFRTEGFWGFYKGFGASLFRVVPHTVLVLVLWNEFRKLYLAHQDIDRDNAIVLNSDLNNSNILSQAFSDIRSKAL